MTIESCFGMTRKIFFSPISAQRRKTFPRHICTRANELQYKKISARTYANEFQYKKIPVRMHANTFQYKKIPVCSSANAFFDAKNRFFRVKTPFYP
jgi:hypothetical protein